VRPFRFVLAGVTIVLWLAALAVLWMHVEWWRAVLAILLLETAHATIDSAIQIKATHLRKQGKCGECGRQKKPYMVETLFTRGMGE
jgi:hypothetical protein